jgi:hypothetical protein
LEEQSQFWQQISSVIPKNLYHTYIRISGIGTLDSSQQEISEAEKGIKEVPPGRN